MNIDWPKRRLIFDRIACVPILINVWWLFGCTCENKLGQKRIYRLNCSYYQCLIIIPIYYLQINQWSVWYLDIGFNFIWIYFYFVTYMSLFWLFVILYSVMTPSNITANINSSLILYGYLWHLLTLLQVMAREPFNSSRSHGSWPYVKAWFSPISYR